MAVLFFGVWGVGVVVSRGSRVVQIFYKAHSSRGFVLVLVLVLVRAWCSGLQILERAFSLPQVFGLMR